MDGAYCRDAVKGDECAVAGEPGLAEHLGELLLCDIPVAIQVVRLEGHCGGERRSGSGSGRGRGRGGAYVAASLPECLCRGAINRSRIPERLSAVQRQREKR